MDTSKEYIEMCKEAYDIQDIWHMHNGDFFYTPNGRNSPEFCISVWIAGNKWCDSAKDKTWLPRQDQLQRLHRDGKTTHLIYDLYRFVFGDEFARAKDKAPDMEYCLRFKSMEQMWLGFIMQEEHGKRWDGKKWKKN